MRVPGLSATEIHARARGGDEADRQQASAVEASSLGGNFYSQWLDGNATKPLTTDPAKPEAVEISAERIIVRNSRTNLSASGR